MRIAARVALAAAAVTCFVGAGTAHAGKPAGAAPACVPGMQVECSCLGGAKAFQVCAPDGASYQPCQCASPAPMVAPAPMPPLTSTAPPMAATDVERIRQLGAEVTQLKQQRSQLGLTVPILTMVGGVALVGGGIALIATTGGTECTSSNTGEYCESTLDTGGTVAGVGLALVGAGAVTLGAIWMVKRLGPRRELADQIKAKGDEMLLIRQTSRVGFVPTRNGGGLFTLAGSF